jgi:DNA-binding SARP family transcriptional activator/TolB-like protein
MIELRLLGLHGLRGPDGRDLGALPAQPKRFALLAYLAISRGDGYHRRDSVAAMFWPDLDQFAARRALRNTLYHLREALGEDVIIARGDDAISINPTELTSDVARLRSAVDSQRYEEAVDCYGGVLLEGMHLPNAGEVFEEWLARERLSVTASVVAALDALVERDELAGDLPSAAHWAQRAFALCPDDERRMRHCMTLLERAGDTGGALRLYDTYAKHLSAEFEAMPSAETVALAQRIRDGVRSAPAPSRAPTRVPAYREPSAPAVSRAELPVAEPLPARIATAQRVRGRRGVIWIGALAVAAILGGLVVRWMRTGDADRGASQPKVLVAIFDNRTADSTLQSLGRMTQDWITQGVLQTHLADVVDPRAVFVQTRAGGAAADPVTLAHRTGARIVVSGNYYRTGDSLLFQANIVDVRTGRILNAVGPVVSGVNAPVAALDELRSRVMSAIAFAVDVRATQALAPAEQLPAFDAYRDYVDAWDAFWHGDSPRAQALFLRAAPRAAAFIAALFGAAPVAANSNDCPLVDSLAHTLEISTSNPTSTALPQRDRLSLQIAQARCRGRNDEMLRLTLERADLEPSSAAAQMSAAAAALWANRPRRALTLLARVNPATDLAWSTDTTHIVYWGGLAEALHMLGDHRGELAAAERLPPGSPLDGIMLRASALAGMSRASQAVALLDSSLSLPVETASNIGLAPFTDGRPQYTMTPAWVANWISRELAVHGDSVASRQAAARAVAWYRSRPSTERATPEERLVNAWSLEMLGEYAEAEAIARQLVAEDSTNVDFRGELAGLAAERGDNALADSLDRWLAAQPVTRVSWTASIYRARLAALQRRPDDAVARTRDAIDEGAWPRWFHEEPALASLKDRADFAALVAPKG